ncbi:MAG: hypothetical protein M0P71_07325 [Melioribacteraceae bacterium]|jgi:hypothetical protein|nr:hypothetical protein [Melioribacteraceae bacterium]MDD3982835.1 hypothetical protein [Candidatus Omnitrophota bacterium]
MKINKTQALKVAKILKVKFHKFNIKDFTVGMNVELEHKDITGGDLIITGKIALAHLKENPDYYKLLLKYVEKPLLSGMFDNG